MRLIQITAGHHLDQAAAASYQRMRAAGMPEGINSSFRSREQQQQLRNAWLAGRGSFAAEPGTSKHEQGLALDLGKAARKWAAQHAAAHGWRMTNPQEAWHYEYFINEDTKAAASVVAQIEGGEMSLPVMVEREDGKGTLLIGETLVTHVVHDAVVSVLNYVGVQGGRGRLRISRDDLRRLCESLGWDFAQVDKLAAGRCLFRNGVVANAGAEKWR